MRQPRSTRLATPLATFSAVARVALVAVLAMLVASGDASAQSKPSVAVLGLEVIDDGTGIDPQTTELAKHLTDALRAHSRLDNSPYRLAPNSDKELLELKLLSGCANEAKECMARIGRDLNADWLIYGKIERRDTGYQVTIKLLNVESMNMARVTTEVIPFADNNAAKISERGRFLFRRLTGIPEQGNVTITANVDQGRVFVDGQLATTLRGGKARIDGLAEGKHPVAIESAGHGRYETSVDIKAGETATLDAELQASAMGAPGTSTGGGDEQSGGRGTLFWVSAGVSAVSVTGFAVTGLKFLYDQAHAADGIQLTTEVSGGNLCSKLETYKENNTPTGDLATLDERCKAGERLGIVTGVFIGKSIASVLLTGILYYTTSNDGSERSAAGTKKSSGSAVTLTPTVTPDYFGAGVKIEF